MNKKLFIVISLAAIILSPSEKKTPAKKSTIRKTAVKKKK